MTTIKEALLDHTLSDLFGRAVQAPEQESNLSFWADDWKDERESPLDYTSAKWNDDEDGDSDCFEINW